MRPFFGPVGIASAVVESGPAETAGGASAATVSGFELVGNGGPF